MISTTQNRIQSKTADRWSKFFANYNIVLSKDNRFIIPHDHPQFDEIMYQIDNELDYDVGADVTTIDMNVRESRLKREEIIWLLEQCGAGVEPQAHSDDSCLTISGEPDHEVSMAHKQLRRTADYAGQLQAIMKDMPEVDLPAWVQAKITSASDYISKVYHYLEDYLSDMARQKGMMDGEAHAMNMLQGEIVAVNEAGSPRTEKDLLKKMLMKINPDRKDIHSAVDGMNDDQVQEKIRTIEKQSPDIYNNIMKEATINEEMEGEVVKARHEVEIELNISKSDMKKLHDGGKVTLKDTTGSNKFTVTVSAS